MTEETKGSERVSRMNLQVQEKNFQNIWAVDMGWWALGKNRHDSIRGQ